MFGLGWAEIIILGLLCIGPIVAALIVLVVIGVLFRGKKSPQADQDEADPR